MWNRNCLPFRSNLIHPRFKCGSRCSSVSFQCGVLQIIVCPFVPFSLGQCIVCFSSIYDLIIRLVSSHFSYFLEFLVHVVIFSLGSLHFGSGNKCKRNTTIFLQQFTVFLTIRSPNTCCRQQTGNTFLNNISITFSVKIRSGVMLTCEDTNWSCIKMQENKFYMYILQIVVCPFVFFLWPLCCMFFFEIRILIAPLVSSSSSISRRTAVNNIWHYETHENRISIDIKLLARII